MTTLQPQHHDNSVREAVATGEHRAMTTERHGFTLIELLVAITVLGALAAIAIPEFANYRGAAQNGQAIADIRKIDLELQVYRRQNNTYPATLADLGVSINNDPWNQSYKYLKIEGANKTEQNKARKDHFLVPLNSDFDLYSIGPDGLTAAPLTSVDSLDDIVRANEGRYVGLGSDY